MTSSLILGIIVFLGVVFFNPILAVVLGLVVFLGGTITAGLFE